MLSTLPRNDDPVDLPHMLQSPTQRAVHIVAEMMESDAGDDLDEFLARLGVVLQLARKHARFTQEAAAQRMGMSKAAFTRWEQGQHKISAYDLARLVRLYEFDPDLALNPPASKVEIRRRLGAVAASARAASRRGLLRPLPPAGADEPG